ncbi:MAG: Sec-independent protein translocase protein TatB [Calditrichaeota bacterium]|nr:Sec-independent protein translocase protein TatB [Calditrichota bacterium]
MFPGGGELVLVFLVVLLLFGGKELPRVARTLGNWSATLRRSLNEVRREFNRISIQEEMEEAAKELRERKPPHAQQPSDGEPRSAGKMRQGDNEGDPPSG